MKDAATLWVLDDAQIQTHTTLSCHSFTEEVGCCVGVLSTYSTCAFAYSTCPSVRLWVCVSCLCLSFYTASLVKKSEPAIYFISQGNKTWGGTHWDTNAQPAQCSSHQFSTHKQRCDGQNCNRRENDEMRDKRETWSKEKREELKLKEIEGREDTNRGCTERQRFIPILLSS